MTLRALLLLVLALGAACGPKSMRQRMRDSERLADRASAALDEADRAATALEPDRLDRALKEAQGYLMEKDLDLYPEAGMLGDRLVELKKRAPEVRAERERVDLEKKLNAAREKLVPKMQALREAVDALPPDAPTAAQAEAVERAALRAKEDLDEVKDLLAKNADFAGWAKGQYVKVDRALEAAKLGKKKAAFLEGPVAARAEGATLWKEAKRTRDGEQRLKLSLDAADKFIACVKDGEAQVKDQELATTSVSVGGKPTAPLTVVGGCKEDLEGVKTELARLKEQGAKKKPAGSKKPKKKK